MSVERVLESGSDGIGRGDGDFFLFADGRTCPY